MLYTGLCYESVEFIEVTENRTKPYVPLYQEGCRGVQTSPHPTQLNP
jgi:hypothetical protein